MEQINDLEGLANYFYGLADGSVEPFSKMYGICHQVDCLFDERFLSTDMLRNFPSLECHFKSWGCYSGSLNYPVPSTGGSSHQTSGSFYASMLSCEGDMWIGDYGDLRKDLCRHIAKQIEKLIPVN